VGGAFVRCVEEVEIDSVAGEPDLVGAAVALRGDSDEARPSEGLDILADVLLVTAENTSQLSDCLDLSVEALELDDQLQPPERHLVEGSFGKHDLPCIGERLGGVPVLVLSNVVESDLGIPILWVLLDVLLEVPTGPDLALDLVEQLADVQVSLDPNLDAVGSYGSSAEVSPVGLAATNRATSESQTSAVAAPTRLATVSPTSGVRPGTWLCNASTPTPNANTATKTTAPRRSGRGFSGNHAYVTVTASSAYPVACVPSSL